MTQNTIDELLKENDINNRKFKSELTKILGFKCEY